ncbi:hypothetical protein AB4Y45_25495 [Paraburkholderia sp. EG287A]|uniref:hypothetical protein n=1 Tax=unclassified Paraburkholderia TaxID=2615204 RepID=UPI0034D23E73
MARVRSLKIAQGHAALLEAIDLCGSMGELARRVNQYVPCTNGRIDQWLRRGVAVPPAVAPFIAHAVNDQVSVYRLCPEYARGWALLHKQLTAANRRRRKADVGL